MKPANTFCLLVTLALLWSVHFICSVSCVPESRDAAPYAAACDVGPSASCGDGAACRTTGAETALGDTDPVFASVVCKSGLGARRASCGTNPCRWLSAGNATLRVVSAGTRHRDTVHAGLWKSPRYFISQRNLRI